KKGGEYRGDYAQDHAPIREHTEIVGHAVRAMYLYIGATDFAQDDPKLLSALERIWQNLTQKRMYVTGGIGPSASNEGFTSDYDLPNFTAYAETCAACGLVFWGQRLLETTGNSEYADIVERALYNGVLSGISLSGDRFFYTNPLESRGNHERVPWFDCACCPPNIARLLGSLGWYVASVSQASTPNDPMPNAFWIHIPAGFEATATIKGVKVRIECESDYPWSGNFKVKVNPETPVEFELRLRIPEWADDVDTDLPGLDKQSEWQQGYAVFAKRWEKGDTLTVDLGIQPKWNECNPKVRDNLGRVALSRGPLVYCAEEHDLGFAPQLFVAATETPVVEREEALLGGVTTLTVEGFADSEDFIDGLYSSEGTLAIAESGAKFVPYFAWCNRGANHMQVWVRRA
ncbi:MAG: glycoside hydrolase family 127 protein, partial [Fimbriimonadales bacterium]